MMIIFFILLETGPVNEACDLVVTILPSLGVLQLEVWKNERLQGTPKVIPIESIHDCIVQEYVGAFRVTNHVVFRTHGRPREDGPPTATIPSVTAKSASNRKKKDDASSRQPTREDAYTQLEPAFPGVELSFTQCLAMRNSIQESLNESVLANKETTTPTEPASSKPKET